MQNRMQAKCVDFAWKKASRCKNGAARNELGTGLAFSIEMGASAREPLWVKAHLSSLFCRIGLGDRVFRKRLLCKCLRGFAERTLFLCGAVNQHACATD